MEVPVEGEIEEERASSDAHFLGGVRKRFQEDLAVVGPSFVLTPDGMIEHVSPVARRLLDYRMDQTIKPSFFGHIHAKNLYQVMRDVADMVCYGKGTANWLVRLRTGKGHWRWFKVTAKNMLHGKTGGIHINLHDLADM